MEKLLFLDFELNNPLIYLNKFQSLLKDEGWLIDLFWVNEPSTKNKSILEAKIEKNQFMIIYKPLTFLSSPGSRKKIQDAVIKDKKNLLLMISFNDTETYELLQQFLVPFKINLSFNKIIDNNTNLKHVRSVVYHKKNKCFKHNELFSGVSKLVIPYAHHLNINPPAKILIQGNPTTELQVEYKTDDSDINGSDIIAGAYYEKTGRIVIVNSTVFLDKFFDFNKPFIKNVITWLGKVTNKKSKK